MIEKDASALPDFIPACSAFYAPPDNRHPAAQL